MVKQISLLREAQVFPRNRYACAETRGSKTPRKYVCPAKLSLIPWAWARKKKLWKGARSFRSHSVKIYTRHFKRCLYILLSFFKLFRKILYNGILNFAVIDFCRCENLRRDRKIDAIPIGSLSDVSRDFSSRVSSFRILSRGESSIPEFSIRRREIDRHRLMTQTFDRRLYGGNTGNSRPAILELPRTWHIALIRVVTQCHA